MILWEGGKKGGGEEQGRLKIQFLTLKAEPNKLQYFDRPKSRVRGPKTLAQHLKSQIYS